MARVCHTLAHALTYTHFYAMYVIMGLVKHSRTHFNEHDPYAWIVFPPFLSSLISHVNKNILINLSNRGCYHIRNWLQLPTEIEKFLNKTRVRIFQNCWYTVGKQRVAFARSSELFEETSSFGGKNSGNFLNCVLMTKFYNKKSVQAIGSL